MAASSKTTLRIMVAPNTEAEARYYRMRAARKASTTERVPQIPAHPEYDLKYRGGKLLPGMAFMNLYVGGSGAWQQSDISQIDQALAGAMQDSGLNNVLQQYFQQPITTTVRSSMVLDGAAAATVSQSDAEQLITSLYTSGKLQGNDFTQTVFNLLLPSGIILNDNGGTGQRTGDRDTAVSSLQGLGGYHDEVNVGGGTTIYYAIGVYSEKLANGQENGVVAFAEPWKNVVATFYHEMCEVRTDPDVNGTPGWITDPAGGLGNQSAEIGDTPIFEAGNNLSLVFQEVALANGSGTVPIQLMYSNAVHGPEGPVSAPRPFSTETGSATPTAVSLGTLAAVIALLGLIAVVGLGYIEHITAATKMPLFIGDIAVGVVATLAIILNAVQLRAGTGRVALIVAMLTLIGAALYLGMGGLLA